MRTWTILTGGAVLLFSSTALAQTSTAKPKPAATCEPECSPGYACVKGSCVSACNPACAADEKCGSDRICHSAAPPPVAPPSGAGAGSGGPPPPLAPTAPLGPEPPPPPVVRTGHRSRGMMLAGISLTAVAAAQLIIGIGMWIGGAASGDEGTSAAGLVLFPLSILPAGAGIPLWVIGALPPKAPRPDAWLAPSPSTWPPARVPTMQWAF